MDGDGHRSRDRRSSATGVVFADYEFGDFMTVDGLADFGGAKAAWFKDSEGNTFELSEVL